MAGYTRQDTANNIANGNVIDADDFDAEYNAVEGAFNASTGHKHDGTAGEGAPITKVGPSQDLIVSGGNVLPKTGNTLDLGSDGAKFKDSFFEGTVTTGDLAVTGGSVLTGNTTVSGTLGVTGLSTLNNLSLTNNATVGGWINVTDNSVFGGTLGITGNTTVGGTLGVTGNSTLSGTLGVTGNTTVGGTLGVTGNTTIEGTLGVTGSSTLAGSVSVEGKTIGEYVQDTVGGMVAGNSENGITVTYQDTDGTLDFNVADPDITLTGGVTGSATMTNLGDVSIATSLDTTSVRAKFSAGEGIDIASGVISGEIATTSNRGIASFDTTDFVVTSGAVSLRHAGVEDIVGGMVTGNSENGISVTYQTADNTLDFNVNDPTISLTGAVTGSATMTNLGNVSITTTATSDPTITLTGAVTGSGTMTNLGNVSISTTATADPTLTLTGDATGSATFTNLGNASLAVTVANDSHTHDDRYYTETESDSRFVRKGAASTITSGSLRFNDNIELALGTGADAEFFCNGSHLYLDLNSGIDNFYIRDGSNIKYTFNDNGNFTSVGSVTATAFYYSSDERLKENITSVTGALDVITNLRGVEFDWKEDGTHDIGVIAQEVEALIPEAVTQSEDADHKTVSAAPIIAYLIEAVKELKAEVDRLNDKP